MARPDLLRSASQGINQFPDQVSLLDKKVQGDSLRRAVAQARQALEKLNQLFVARCQEAVLLEEPGHLHASRKSAHRLVVPLLCLFGGIYDGLENGFGDKFRVFL